MDDKQEKYRKRDQERAEKEAEAEKKTAEALAERQKQVRLFPSMYKSIRVILEFFMKRRAKNLTSGRTCFRFISFLRIEHFFIIS